LIKSVGELDRIELTLNVEPGELLAVWRGLEGSTRSRS